MKKKTLKGWNKSNLNLDEYLTEPCEIDEELYLGKYVPPQYWGYIFTQCGEVQKHQYSEGNKLIAYFMSASKVKNKYFYLGILPEFNQ